MQLLTAYCYSLPSNIAPNLLIALAEPTLIVVKTAKAVKIEQIQQNDMGVEWCKRSICFERSVKVISVGSCGS